MLRNPLSMPRMFLSAAAVLAAFSFPVRAQGVPCAPREAVAGHLAEKFGERPVGRGVDGRGRVLEVFASRAGSWSLLVSVPRNGGVVACLLSHGDGWESVPAAASPAGEAS